MHQQVVEQGKVLADIYRSGGTTALDDAIDDTMTYADPQTVIALVRPRAEQIKGNVEPSRPPPCRGRRVINNALVRLQRTDDAARGGA